MKAELPFNKQAPLNLSEFCAALSEYSPLPTAAVEGPCHILCYSNAAFSLIMGRPKEQLVGKPFCEITHLSSDCVALMDRVARTRIGASHTEHEFSRPRPAFWSYTLWPAIADKKSLGIVIQVTETTQFHERMLSVNEALVQAAVRQDELIETAASSNAQLHEEIAARKQTEEVLHRARIQLADRAGELERAVTERTAELLSINRQLDAFVYTIAHDLRAPLRSMQGFSAMLVEDGGSSLSETGRDFANRINDSARFMDSLLHDLLLFSRVAKEKIHLEPVDLQTAVKSVVARLDDQIRQKNCAVEVTGPSFLALAHGPTLGQVLTNLLSNALKFTKLGVASVVKVRFENLPLYIRVVIEDNGLGIPKDQCEKIFQLFTRLSADEFSGTGIGLAIVEKGIERMNGRLGVDSVVGEGSCFWFELKKP